MVCKIELLDAREIFFCPHFLVKKVKSKIWLARTVGGSLILKEGSCFFVITAEQNPTFACEQVRIDARSFFVKKSMSKVRFAVGGRVIFHAVTWISFEKRNMCFSNLR